MFNDVIKNIENIVSNKLININDLLYTIKETSYSISSKMYMTDKNNIVINGDKLKEICNGLGYCTDRLKATDAIYIFKNNKIYLIEFKCGSIKKEEIYQKMYDTYILLRDLEIITNLQFSLMNVHYILVYNKIKYTEKENIYHKKITENLRNKSNTTFKNTTFFNINIFENYLFKEAFACNEEDFNKFIIKEFDVDEI